MDVADTLLNKILYVLWKGASSGCHETNNILYEKTKNVIINEK